MPLDALWGLAWSLSPGLDSGHWRWQVVKLPGNSEQEAEQKQII